MEAFVSVKLMTQGSLLSMSIVNVYKDTVERHVPPSTVASYQIPAQMVGLVSVYLMEDMSATVLMVSIHIVIIIHSFKVS